MSAAPAARGARIGPNAVIQTAAALRALCGETVAAAVFRAAGVSAWLAAPPQAMADEAPVAALHRAMAARAPEAAVEAGRLTADYLLAHRIPKAAQALLRRLPRALAARALLAAIRANAWTFAGSGRVRVSGWRRPVIEIAENPLATPGCRWHCGVFERLFRALVSPAAHVRHVACRATGGGFCRFEIAL